jgi:hypothetical protein
MGGFNFAKNMENFERFDTVPTTTSRSPATITGTVFWDFENCAVPTGMRGYNVVKAVRKYTDSFNITLRDIYAIGNTGILRQGLYNELQSANVLLHHVSSGKESAADMDIVAEIMKDIYRNPTAHMIMLISGDRDFSKILNFLDTETPHKIVLVHSGKVSEGI